MTDTKTVPYSQQRFYNADPNTIDIEICASHGNAHAWYRWNKQIDPRWSDEKQQAYIDAYDQAVKDGAK